MQLTKVHLLLILLLSLILASSLGNYIRDGFTSSDIPDPLKSVATKDQAGSSGSGGGSGGGSGENKCPPCPACARCPEPAFECKKVPNYSRSEDINAPKPVMADFSQFGM